MKMVRLACRVLLALALTAFGLDKFLHFMPQPEPPPEGGAFLGALVETGYIFPTIGVVFLVSAACLLLGRVALALLLLAPILVNILLYHYRYDMPGIVAGAVIAGLMLVLFALHASDFAPLFAGTRETNKPRA